MVGDRRFADPEYRGELFHRLRLLREQADDPESVRLGEGLKETDEFVYLVFHGISFVKVIL